MNTTILIKGNTEIVIPVSCVEQGRWSYDGQRFASEKRIMAPKLRAQKSAQVHTSLKASGSYRSDQGAIWREISDKARRRGAESPSMAMAEIYKKDMPSVREYLKHFRVVDSQVGAVFMINGEVVGMDAFGKADSFSNVFIKLLQSYALDAVDWFEPDKEKKALRSEVTGFLKNSSDAEVESRRSVGEGTDLRLESKKLTGFALAVDDQILHLSIFARDNDEEGHIPGSKMDRFSSRRRNRT